MAQSLNNSVESYILREFKNDTLEWYCKIISKVIFYLLSTLRNVLTEAMFMFILYLAITVNSKQYENMFQSLFVLVVEEYGLVNVWF